MDMIMCQLLYSCVIVERGGREIKGQGTREKSSQEEQRCIPGTYYILRQIL